MEKKNFYVDTCIWINIINKENYSNYIPIFVNSINCVKLLKEKHQIIISEIILKELDYKLNRFQFIRNFLKDKRVILKVIISSDIDLARIIEKENNYQIGFYDCIHISFCKRLNLCLITRDKELIKIAKIYIKVFTPEEILHLID